MCPYIPPIPTTIGPLSPPLSKPLLRRTRMRVRVLRRPQRGGGFSVPLKSHLGAHVSPHIFLARLVGTSESRELRGHAEDEGEGEGGGAEPAARDEHHNGSSQI